MSRNTSTAPTRVQRRRENWGPSVVRPTTSRRFSDPRGHAAPKSGRNHAGRPWSGWSRNNDRKPFRPMRTNWRTWWRNESMRRWRADR